MTSGTNAVADTIDTVAREDARRATASASPAAGETHFDDSMLMHGPDSEPIDTTPFAFAQSDGPLWGDFATDKSTLRAVFNTHYSAS